MKIKLRNFDGGLVLTPPVDKLKENALWYARGINRLSRGSVRQRQGSTSLHAVASIELGSRGVYYWNDSWFYGTSNSLYQGTTVLSSGTYDGSRLTFAVAGPTAGYDDVLFITGGSTATLRKVSTANTVTYWGIAPPLDTLTVTSGGTTGGLTTGADYQYRLTYYNDQTGTRSNPTTLPSTVGIVSSETVLLLHCTGDHSSTTFNDVSPSCHTVTAAGDAQKSTATADPFGNDIGVMLLEPATASYCTVPPHNDFYKMFNYPWGMEAFINFIALPADGAHMGLFQVYTSTANFWSYSVYRSGSNYYLYFLNTVGGVAKHSVSALIGAAPTTGTWYHVCAVRESLSDSIRLGWNGVLPFGVPNATQFTPSFATLEIGKSFLKLASPAIDTTATFNGRLSEIRFTVGSAPYTETSYTAPTEQFAAAWLNTGADEVALSLANIPPSTDSQVTHTEIWRTAADGSAFYLASRIESSLTSFKDTVADTDLGTDELPTDNLKPYNWFDDCVVHNASMFWITRTQAGELGRIYYSPIGRLEAVEGFINVTDDAEPLQKLVKYGPGLGVFSDGGFYEILGENPYYSRPVPGVPGTVEPFSVAITPYGVAYEAADGPRLLSGGGTQPIADGTLDAVFQGEARGQLSAWGTGTWAIYARDEYILCDTTGLQSVAINMRNGRCRDLGLPLRSIYYAPQVDKIAAYTTASSAVWEIEKEGKYSDAAGVGIPFQIQTATFTHPSQQNVLVRNVFVDAESTRTMSFILVHSQGTTETITGSGATRTVYELPYNQWTRDFALRITATTTTTGDVEIYGIDFDLYVPPEEKE